MNLGLRTAVTFLTILRPPGGADDAAALGRSLAWFPAVGALVGIVLAAAAACLGAALPPGPATVLVVLLWALLTGGLHLDGVSDVCDGLFSSRSRDEALRIMRDPHAGTMGVVGVVGVVLLKIAALAVLVGLETDPTEALVAACLVGRWAVVAAAATSRYARAETGGGLASGVIEVRPARLIAASAWLVPAGYLLPGLVAAVAVAAVVTVLLRALFIRRFGGLTGDCLGAICEAVEAAALCAYAAVVR